MRGRCVRLKNYSHGHGMSVTYAANLLTYRASVEPNQVHRGLRGPMRKTNRAVGWLSA